MKIEVGAATHVGMKRSQNQDSFAVDADIGVFLIADGMGGHRGGETASLLAVQTIVGQIRASRAGTATGGSRQGAPNVDDEPRKLITDAVQAANYTIHERASREPELQGMGTTSTLLYVESPRQAGSKPRAWIGHVGDSRCYLLKGREIWQLTRDHSLVQEKLRAGLITRAELKTDRMKNVITRSVGFEKVVDVEIYELPPIEAGDTFVICSDGLSGMIDDPAILSTVIAGSLSIEAPLQKAAEALIMAANQAGGEDNVTAIVVRAR
jgi:protein phosphatase